MRITDASFHHPYIVRGGGSRSAGFPCVICGKTRTATAHTDDAAAFNAACEARRAELAVEQTGLPGVKP